jgi:hypothetical protein
LTEFVQNVAFYARDELVREQLISILGTKATLRFEIVSLNASGPASILKIVAGDLVIQVPANKFLQQVQDCGACIAVLISFFS